MLSGSPAIILLSTETSALKTWVLARVFLAANRVEITFERADAVKTMLALTAGDLGEDELADWFRQQIQPA